MVVSLLVLKNSITPGIVLDAPNKAVPATVVSGTLTKSKALYKTNCDGPGSPFSPLSPFCPCSPFYQEDLEALPLQYHP